jgi:hypothetical protein
MLGTLEVGSTPLSLVVMRLAVVLQIHLQIMQRHPHHPGQVQIGCPLDADMFRVLAGSYIGIQ